VVVFVFRIDGSSGLYSLFFVARALQQLPR
jgi:hypothetical protein